MKKTFTIFSCMAVLLFTGCSDSGKEETETDKFNRSELSLTSGETFQLEIVTGNKSAYIFSGNEMVAKVSSTGLVTAMRVGQCNIAAGYARCAVTVTARFNYYTEPTEYWGKSKAEIKQMLGNPTAEADAALGYTLTDSFFMAVSLTFETDKVVSVNYFLNVPDTDRLLEFLDERYVRVTPSSDSYDYMYYNALTESLATLKITVGAVSSDRRSVVYSLKK